MINGSIESEAKRPAKGKPVAFIASPASVTYVIEPATTVKTTIKPMKPNSIFCALIPPNIVKNTSLSKSFISKLYKSLLLFYTRCIKNG